MAVLFIATNPLQRRARRAELRIFHAWETHTAGTRGPDELMGPLVFCGAPLLW